MQVKVDSNFCLYGEYILYLKKELLKLLKKYKKYNLIKNISMQENDFELKCLTVLIKSHLNKIIPKPKKIYYSKEFISKFKTCKYKMNIKLIEKFIQNGDEKINDVRFLSKYAFQFFNPKENINARIFIDRGCERKRRCFIVFNREE